MERRTDRLIVRQTGHTDINRQKDEQWVEKLTE